MRHVPDDGNTFDNRNARALEEFRTTGFSKLKNLTGGIRARSDEVDPSVPKY